MSKNPKVGIVILNYNGQVDTMNCLQSILKTTYANFITIVIDNGSIESPLNLITTKYPSVTVIQNKQNLGFAEGSNIGILEALKQKCEFILLLNNDTEIDKDLIQEFIQASFAKPLGAIFGPKILKLSEPDKIDHIGGVWDKAQGEFVSLGNNEHLSSKDFNLERQVDYVCGCCMFIKKEVFEKIGLLEKDFFLLWEESDFCARAKRAGFEIWTVPNALVWHKISTSFSGGKIHTEYYWWRNRLLWIKRNLSSQEKIKIYLKTIIPQLFNLYKITFLKELQFIILKFLFPSSITEKKIIRLLRCKSRCRGTVDFFLKRFGPSPGWVTSPQQHPIYLFFKTKLEKSTKK